MRAHQQGPGEFKHGGGQHRLADGESAGAHRGAHRIGDIISADVPGHVETKEQGQIGECPHLQARDLRQGPHHQGEGEGGESDADADRRGCPQRDVEGIRHRRQFT